MAKPKGFLTCRKIISIVLPICFIVHSTLRANISIAIVDMIPTNNSNTTSASKYHFNWDQEQRNNILGFFFLGYFITSTPGGRFAEIFGTRLVIGITMLLASLITVLIPPVAINFGYYWLVALRVALGLALGMHWPSLMPMASKWIPPTDNSKFVSHTITSSLGYVITLPFAGYLIAYFGWPSVFYVTGMIGILFSFVWFYLVYDSPQQHPRISREEKEIIEEQMKNLTNVKTSPSKVPWKPILSSGPVWAIILTNVTCLFSIFFINTQLPTYMDQVLHFNIKTNGILSGFPHIARYLIALFASFLADKIYKSKKISVTTLRKIFTISSSWGMSVMFLVQFIWGDSYIVSVGFCVSIFSFLGLMNGGFFPNAIDLAPNFAGTIFGLCNTLGGLSGFIGTKIVAEFTKENHEFQHWRYIFLLHIITHFASSIFYLIFGSGEIQNWSIER